jgi:tol-pal system-associated acyl-CoA thioesterase
MEKRIFYHDTDAGGVVYYGNYLKYLEEARTEFLDKKGLSVKGFHDLGFLYAVRKCNVIYRSPARYGDVILCDAKLNSMSAAQMIFEQKIYAKNDGRILVEAEVTLVSLTKDFKPTVIPDDIRKMLSS